MAGTSNIDRSYMDASAADYTKYTDESVWEESFEVDQKMDTLLHFNKCLLEGFNNFSNKDIPSLISSYQNALEILEKGKSPNHFDNMITIKSNLGIAHYFNNEIDKAILYNEDALKMIVNSGRSIDRQLETVQSLYIKILCNLIVFKMVKKEDQECQEIARKLISFLNSLQDQKKKRLFIKETIYILFRLESLSDINAKYVETMKENVKGANQGCFLLMVGIYCASKGDNQNALNYYTQSFEVFDTLNDELFMLLTTRLICNCYDQMKVRSKTRNDYEEAYEMLLKEPIFKDINVDILFENFDRRLELARTVAPDDADHAGPREHRKHLPRRPVQVRGRRRQRRWTGDDCARESVPREQPHLEASSPTRAEQKHRICEAHHPKRQGNKQPEEGTAANRRRV